jgi:hypothetical protein
MVIVGKISSEYSGPKLHDLRFMYDIECLFIIKENSAGCLGWVRPMCGRCCLLVLFQLVLFVMLWTLGGVVQAVYVKANRMLNHACNPNVLEPNL